MVSVEKCVTLARKLCFCVALERRCCSTSVAAADFAEILCVHFVFLSMDKVLISAQDRRIKSHPSVSATE